MSNVVNLFEFKFEKNEMLAYKAKILGLDRLELLEEMVRFQEERSRTGHLTHALIEQGIVLFKALEESAETNELRLLTRSYRRHLQYEKDLIQKKVKGE